MTAADFGYADYAAAPAPKIYRHAPDPLRSMDALYAGMAMCAGETPLDLPAVIWALMIEAAQTERSIRKPGPSGYISAYPEVYHSPAEIIGLYNQMVADQISYPPQVRIRAGAAALSRYMEVTAWLRFVGGRDRAKSKRVLWRLAQGAPAGLIARQEGYGSARGVQSKKKRELDTIAARLRAEIGPVMALLGC